jgi:hopanoid biosynthesis associated protein HpnK
VTSPTKHLILNADDFGLTRGVNEGIVRAHRDGILTSATLMANGPAFDHAIELACATRSLGIGCHLVLVGGHCVAPAKEIPSLAQPDGRLPNSLPVFAAHAASGRIRQSDIERELRAQIEKIRCAGISPTHFDTHKHTHIVPRVLEVIGRVARDTGINAIRKPFERLRHSWSGAPKPKQLFAASAVRVISANFRKLSHRYGLRSPDHFLGLALTGGLGPAALLRLLESLPAGQTEIMFHPGLADADLRATGSRLQHERELELAALVDPAVKRAVAAHHIELISYRDLR